MIKNDKQIIENQKKAIAKNIKRYLKKLNMTQSELAEHIGISKSTLSDYMNYRAKPGAIVLEKMAVVFGVSKSEIDTTYQRKEADSSYSKQYEKGYLEGQLDSAKNELEILYRIKEESNEIWHTNSFLLTRIKDTENFLKANGR